MSQEQASRVVGPSVRSVHDITKVFKAACQDLRTARLVKDANFTLLESVGALEVRPPLPCNGEATVQDRKCHAKVSLGMLPTKIMDPKMDSGYLDPGGTFDDDYEISRELLPEEIIGIMDQLLCHEAAWHMGQSLSQTLFTSIYLDRLLWPVPHNLESARFDRPGSGRMAKKQGGIEGTSESSCVPTLSTLVSLVLRAYCLCLVKTAGRVFDRITRELYFEEEDFVSQTYNQNFLSGIKTSDIVVIVDEALSWLDSQDKEPEYANNLAPGKPQTNALKARLVFRREFLIALEGDFNMLERRDTSSFKAARGQLDVILQSFSQQREKDILSVSKPVPEAFRTKMQHHLTTFIQPKPIVDIVSLRSATAFLSQLCTDAVDVVELVGGYEGPQCLFTAVTAFTFRKRPGHARGIAQLGREPSVYARCLAQAFLLHPTRNASDERRGQIRRHQMLERRHSGAPLESAESVFQVLDGISLKNFVHQSLTELVLPHSRNNSLGPNSIGLLDPQNENVEAPFDDRFKVSKIMSKFIARVGPFFADLYRSLCLNRCRVRRNMTHMLVDWDVIQSEAEAYDTQLIKLTNERGVYLQANSVELTFMYPLSSWVYHHKLRQIRHIIQMGFELEIYAVDEMAGMYYYLSQICANHLAHIDRIRVCVVGAERYWSRAFGAGLSSDVNVANPAAEEASISLAYARTYALLDRLSTELSAIDAFAIAMHSLIALLERYGLLGSSKSVPPRNVNGTSRRKNYASSKLRYELRMKPFLPLAPPEVMPFETFERAVCLEGQSDEAVLGRAKRAIAEAKKGLERHIALGMHSGSDEVPSSILRNDWIVGAKDTLRACIGGSLAITQLSEVMKPDPSAKRGEHKQRESLPLEATVPTVDDIGRWHAWWAVPRLMSATPISDSPLP